MAINFSAGGNVTAARDINVVDGAQTIGATTMTTQQEISMQLQAEAKKPVPDEATVKGLVAKAVAFGSDAAKVIVPMAFQKYFPISF
jgi:hypothetical protein